MPSKWMAEDELKMLLGVITITNVQVPGSVWSDVAAYMGEGYTAEAVRQKFNSIKRSVPKIPTTTNSETSTITTATPTTSRYSKGKGSATKATITKAATNSASRGCKRKAATQSAAEDDDEEALFQPKATKFKKEEVAEDEAVIGSDTDAIGVEIFKTEPEEEDGEGVIDGEKDE